MCLYPNYVLKTTVNIFESPVVEYKFCGRSRGEDFYGSDLIQEYISVPCGKCIECLNHYSDEWSFRIIREAKLHRHNCMLTLTYANAPPGGVCKRDFQLFMKSLRKAIAPTRIRFFACGEYGSKGQRPHYHAIIFGWIPGDLESFFVRNGHTVYKSSFVEKIWKHGYISVEDVTIDSAKYCAKYLQKLQNLPFNLAPPFTLMSNRPGIGFVDGDYSYLATDKLYHHGRYISTPRYLLKKAESAGLSVEALKARRVDNALLYQVQSNKLLARRQRFVARFGNNILKKS